MQELKDTYRKVRKVDKLLKDGERWGALLRTRALTHALRSFRARTRTLTRALTRALCSQCARGRPGHRGAGAVSGEGVLQGAGRRAQTDRLTRQLL